MKKIFSIILCAAVVLTAGCSGTSQEEQYSYYAPINRSERESSRIEESIAREDEIEEVDKWGVSLDDVERLAKQAIRKYENISDYRQDYRKAIRETDDYLKDVEDGKDTEESWADFLENYNESCEAGIEYIESCAGDKVNWQYDLCIGDGELDKTDKDLIRTVLTLWNNSIQAIEQSKTDMESYLNPIIAEERELTDDELEKVFEIYQVLIDKVDTANKFS